MSDTDESMERSSSPLQNAPTVLLPTRKRKRNAHACDNCRMRKTRCNGEAPCDTCESISAHCTYGNITIPRAKTDIMLKVVMQSHDLVKQLLEESRNNRSRTEKLHLDDKEVPSTNHASRLNHGSCPIANASIPSHHTSSAESMLKWPIFDEFPSLRNEFLPVYYLESLRLSIGLMPVLRWPYTDPGEVDRILDCFRGTVNYWMPTLSLVDMDRVRELVLSGDSNLTCDYCLAMLVMALGWACDMMNDRSENGIINCSVPPNRHKKQMSSLYFDAALRAGSLAHLETSRVAAHCSLLMVLYLAFLQRPIQAWQLLDSTALKCRLLLDNPSLTGSADDNECIRRIFWSCYILESDYLVEFSGLPDSRLGTMESSILPLQPLKTHKTVSESSEALEYFLACISIRRLLNRSHHILYSEDYSTYGLRFHSLICELQHQLYNWWSCLPQSLKFDLDINEDGVYFGASVPKSDCQRYLAARFLACQSVVLRPYLVEHVHSIHEYRHLNLSDGPGHVVPAPHRSMLKSLKACVFLAFAADPVLHTLITSAWTMSCSVVSTMLTFLASNRLLGPALGPLRLQTVEAGETLVSILHSVNALHIDSSDTAAEQSPSMNQNLRLVESIRDLLRESSDFSIPVS